MTRLVVDIPGLQTVAEHNAHEHKWARIKRVRAQHEAVLRALDAIAGPRCPFPLPLRVRLVRRSAGRLDAFDNLPSALKHVADAVAWWARGRVGEIGQADRDESELEFVAAQERCRRGDRGVRVELEPKPETCPVCGCARRGAA